MNNVFLIGMPGCGKTTVANIFKERGKTIFDTDARITQTYGEINEIFSAHGEEYFRNLETRVLKEIDGANADCIVSVGGGCVLREENVKVMRSDGNKIVYLRAKIPTLEKRLKNDNSRPLLRGDLHARLEKLFHDRSRIYEGSADIVIDADGLTPEQVANKILELIK